MEEFINTRKTPQSEPVPGKDQKKNRAGGFVFKIDEFSQLRRFLILGTQGGTYYASQREMATENYEVILRCLKQDSERTLNMIKEVSDGGLAPSNDPALFALAAATLHTPRAYDYLPYVARIGTHLFHFAEYRKQLGCGWGRGMRKAVSAWYNDMEPDRLAYQVLKYQQRDGWSHRDLLRLAHPEPASEEHDKIFGYVTQAEWDHNSPALIQHFEHAKRSERPDEISILVREGLTREMIPTEFLNEPRVWEALLEKMPMHAMLRNLGKMSSLGLFRPMTGNEQLIVSNLTSQEAITRSRLHPYSILLALKTYASGSGFRGSLTWTPNKNIVDALDTAFELSFGNIEPAGKRTLIGLDVSGSMGVSLRDSNLTVREASAAMCMVTARTEEQYHIMGFTAGSRSYPWRRRQENYDGFIDLGITRRSTLNDVVHYVRSLDFGPTDCALPMLWAMKNQVEVDTFVIYTDNETWRGSIHPFQALKQYRERFVSDARLVVVAMTATDVSIADPNDPGMLDVVGFDTSAPQLIAEFSRGGI